MPKKQFKYHPIIEGLKVNEDGTEMYLGVQKLKILQYKLKHSKVPAFRVNLRNQTHCVAKLVCETWHGMRPDRSFCAHRKNDYETLHYTNLYWGKCGANHLRSIKRSKLSKIDPKEIPKIVERIKRGETFKKIAKDYNTSDMSISRIKKRFINNAKTN